MSEKVGLSAPWVKFYREINALFGDDPDIRVVYDEDNVITNIYVEDADKADALTQLLPVEKEFGNVTMQINVIPANTMSATKASLITRAFRGNPAYSYGTTVEGIFSSPIHYVVFKNKVVQYFNDDLGDVNGNCSTLYQEIAKDVIGESEGIHFCTDVETDGVSLGAPLRARG